MPQLAHIPADDVIAYGESEGTFSGGLVAWYYPHVSEYHTRIDTSLLESSS